MDSSEEYLEEWEEDDNTSGSEDIQLAELKPLGPSSDWKAENGDGDPDDKYPFKVLFSDQILKLMSDYICEGSNVLELPPTTLRLLFNHFRWDKEKLLEAFCERDHDELFQEAGVAVSLTGNPTPVVSDSNGIEECAICFTEVVSLDMYGMECGHRFCKQCWESYLVAKIDEGKAEGIACAAHKCPMYVDDATVMKLVTVNEVKLKYQRLITNCFVQCNRLLRWCPSPGCDNAIQVQWVDCEPVKCGCGHKFCFGCGNKWHAPIKCEWFKRWEKKILGDVMSSKWILANTKNCPKCHADIEKNGGCNHILCSNLNCHFEFCWLCLGPWEAHGYTPCNKYDPAKIAAANFSRENSKAVLNRYMFYYDRFMSHAQSLKLEGLLVAKVKAKMEEMQEHNMTWVEVQFLEKAVDILHECRQTLMYTYVFAFYLKTSNQSVIFEGNQKDLENATETLSGLLERDVFTSDGLEDIRGKVQDKYRYCEGRRKVLLEHVREGYEKDWWDLNTELI